MPRSELTSAVLPAMAAEGIPVTSSPVTIGFEWKERSSKKKSRSALVLLCAS